MSEFDDIDFNDSDLDQALNEAEQEQQQEEDDDFGDDFGDDLDLDELVEVSESVEQQHAANNGVNISFVPPTDPSPPPALPESTRSFHPLDVENLRTWIYPTNYPIRGYQLNIVQKAMFHNTLVALPTGLGKTFIAAVVMFNYWRWFPNSIIIFMAPSRPLVTQQIEACFRICGLPQSDTCDISGTVAPAKRKELYKSKRVFFSTPQTIRNDLISKSCPVEKIVCIVVDEAHRATGNYAYCGVVNNISKKHQDFRVLALTATPGSRLEVVQNVVDNLHISHIQIRTEESMDIREFSHGKNIQSIIVRLDYTEGSTGILPKIIQEFRREVFEPVIKKLQSTPAKGHLPSTVDSVTTYGLTAARTRFGADAQLDNSYKYRVIKQILVAEQMSRAYDLLCQHGIYPFMETIEQHRQEYEEVLSMGKNLSYAERNYYDNAYIKRMIPNLKREMSKPDFMGHPKMDQLVAILLKHFTDLSEGESSKVIVFSSFRSSVTEICKVLDRHRPIIRCSHFVGQSDGKNGLKGLKQSEQQEVIQKFKQDELNVLVSTSIGEEGLDIGEVDLIVCYDSQSSPIRMLQRMGRAGRKRQGKCFMIMTELENKKFNQAKETYARVQKLITQGTYLTYYKPNPVIIPANYKPTICRKELTIGRYEQTEVKRKRRTPSSSSKISPNVDANGLMNETTERQFLQSISDDLNHFRNLSQAISRYWPYKPGVQSLNKYLPFQTKAKPIYRVGNSKRTLRFIQHIEQMENRILYPDREMKPTIPSSAISSKPQTTLKMPSKASSSSTIKIPKRKKPVTQAEEMEEALNDFMEENDFSHILNNTVESDDDLQPPETTSRRVILDDFFAPRKRKEKARVVERASLSPPPINDSVEDMSLDELPDLSCPSFKPSIATNDKANIPANTSRDKGKGKMTVSQEMSLLFDDDDNSNVDDASILHDPILPENLFEEAVPFENKPISKTELKLGANKFKQKMTDNNEQPKEEIMEIDMDDLHDASDNNFGDSLLDGMLIEAENQALAISNDKGFDDVLPPKFPFENERQEHHINHVTFVWTQSTPNFSEEAFRLLEKRQNSIKELTGKFVAMNIITKFKLKGCPTITEKSKSLSIHSPKQSPLKQEQSYSQDFDEFDLASDFLEQAVALEQNLLQNQESKQEPVLTSRSPIRNNVVQDEREVVSTEQAKDDVYEEEEGFEGFSDVDFDEFNFTSMIENKLSDDETGYHPFVHQVDDHSFASQQASQMKEKQSLYSQKTNFYSPKKSATPSETSDVPVKINKLPLTSALEEVYEIDFSDTPSPPPVKATEEEIVYEYDFNSSSSEEEPATNNVDTPSEIDQATSTESGQQRIVKSVHSSPDNDFEVAKTPVAQRTFTNTRIQSNTNSPNKLLQMSKGLSPSVVFSPLNNSPLRKTPVRHSPAQNLFGEDSDESPHIPVRRRKRRIIEMSPMEECEEEEESQTSSKPKKRLKRKSSSPLLTTQDGNVSVVEISNDEDSEDGDDFAVFAPPSKHALLQRLEECKEEVPAHKKNQRRIKQSIDDLAGNPFMDVEAERSSDEGHTSDEEEEGGSSILNSFIDDGSEDFGSRISIDNEDHDLDQNAGDGIQKKKKKVNIYMQSMLNDDMVSNNSKHWMNRFDANKWLNATEDSIIEEDDEGHDSEEEEREEDIESVTEFSSHLAPINDDPVYNIDDDDDFM